MAVQFAQPYRFSEQQLARMAAAGIVPEYGTQLVDGVPYWAGTPVRFSSDDYFRLAEIGVLRPNERVELIDGDVVAMSPEGTRHFACVSRLMRLLTLHAGESLVVSHGTLFLPDQYRPMPDVMVLRPSETDYEDAHPTHADALVVVEVADSSERYDRIVKIERYAEAGIPEYWLVDLTRDTITVHGNPAAGEYRDLQTYSRGDEWFSAALGGPLIPVDAILKPRG
jgi:Uma2 family endonuclease